MSNAAIQTEALSRAQAGQSFTNYPAIIRGFTDRGIPENDILPRENVFTFHAWKALGRVVKKGEHGVKVCTYVPMTKKTTGDDGTETVEQIGSKPRTAFVFHVSQTKAL